MKLHKRIDLLGNAIALIRQVPGGKDAKSSVGHVEYQNQVQRLLSMANRAYWCLCDEDFNGAQQEYNEIEQLVKQIKEKNNLIF